MPTCSFFTTSTNCQMTSSTVVTILNTGISGISSYFTTLLPVILPVAIGLAVLFGILWWIRGSSRRHV